MKKERLSEQNILDQLEELARTLEIQVRYESIKEEASFFAGGLCRVKGEYILIVNSDAHLKDKIDTLTKALKNFDLSEIYIRPALREFLSN